MSLDNISCQKSFGGWHKRYRHHSKVLGCDMVFAVYLPPQAEQGEKLPVLYWLSGLTCTDENFMQKAGAQRLAAELGLIIVAPIPARVASRCRAIRTAPGTSAWVLASTSTPPSNPGPSTTACTTMWWRSCQP